MALPACAAGALGPPLQPERGAPARTPCPRRHSRVEAELAASRPGSVAASVRAGPPRGVSRGFNSQPLLDEPLKAAASLAGAARAPLFALLLRGRRRRMHDLRRRWDLGSLCRALLTRGLAALGHFLKHVLGAIFSKIFGPLGSVGNMDEKSNKLLLALVMLFLFAVIILQYVCPGTECQLLRLQAFSSPLPDRYRSEDESSARFVPRYNFSRGDLLRKVDFDIKCDDLIVFLHIQKTGGTTFGRHLVRNIQLEQPCECCRETWLFSRFSTGWSCGLHADWTELTSCVPAVVDGKRDARLRPSRRLAPWRVGARRCGGSARGEAAGRPGTSAPRQPPGQSTESPPASLFSLHPASQAAFLFFDDPAFFPTPPRPFPSLRLFASLSRLGSCQLLAACSFRLPPFSFLTLLPVLSLTFYVFFPLFLLYFCRPLTTGGCCCYRGCFPGQIPHSLLMGRAALLQTLSPFVGTSRNATANVGFSVQPQTNGALQLSGRH
ncbi:hypothetical protein FD755_023232 [Muntiacus reevesi]|uniref:Heparan-sulfate 6-O-sulfotransferase n=1 Tax=Muntiacus reevesi TaxID=9886 RepID=A0A5N3VXI5_MUNRE|nr:hypothetical protein FD755_023232 [Muntiacus reevesi]